MKKSLITYFVVFLMLFTTQSAYGFQEDFNFLTLEMPEGWKVVEKADTEFTLVNDLKTAFFKYKVHHLRGRVSAHDFATALMVANNGYEMKLLAFEKYRFDFIYGARPAWTIVTFQGSYAFAQTGIGESEDFEQLIDAGRLKDLSKVNFPNITPNVEKDEK